MLKLPEYDQYLRPNSLGLLLMLWTASAGAREWQGVGAF